MVRQQPRPLGMLDGRRTVALLVATCAAAGLLASCGGGSSSPSAAKATTTAASKTTTTAKATTTEPPTTTTTAPQWKSSPQTVTATLTVVDMGKAWKLYGKEPVSGSASEGCGDTPVTAAEKAVSASSSGEILQRGDRSQYVQTVTWQFADATKAEAYAQARLTDGWIECLRTGTEKGWKKETPKRTVMTYGVERRTTDSTFRGQFSFEFDEQVKGQPVYSQATATHLVYRKGAIVVDAFIQQAPLEGDPPKLSETTYGEITAGMEKVLGRIAG